MMLTVPDHYAPNVGGAMVERAARVIEESGIVPAFLHQYAVLWDKGLRYGAETFWDAVRQHNKATDRTLRKAGL